MNNDAVEINEFWWGML